MTKPTTPRAPRASKKERDAAAAEAKRIADAMAIAGVTLPTQEQLDREAAEAQAEEAANLAREAEELASESAKPAVDGYDGPMLALRHRAKQGLYTKAANGQLCCADPLALKLGSLPPEGVIRACIVALNLPANPYTHLNIGQQSMNLRNKLRHALKTGVFGFGVVAEAVETVEDQIAMAKAEHDAANQTTPDLVK